MQRLQDLLHRIRWDADFGRGVFSLGYYDRVARQEQVVPFTAVSIDPENASMMRVQDADGTTRFVPFHRVRTVYKNGVVIWQRPTRAAR